MIPVLSIHQPYASLIFAPAHCGECGGSGLTDDRDSDGYQPFGGPARMRAANRSPRTLVRPAAAR
jgi:hypothetical protein